ncbi:MAG TPA: hypothetical protein VGF10_07915 [Gaiella sp.]
METSVATCRHRAGSGRARIALLAVLVAGTLALPGIAVADPAGDGANTHGTTAEEAIPGSSEAGGNGTDNAATATSATTPTEAAGQPGDDQDSSSTTEETAAQGVGEQSDAVGNDEEGAEDENTGMSSDNAPQSAAAGSAEEGAATEQSAVVDQGASATAVADQHGQGGGNAQADDNGHENDDGNAYGHGNGNGNTHTEVRVDEPGSADGVSQLNEASATADATASASVDSGDAAVTQAADASATATQGEIGNVHVSVRVESPGDDRDVTQVNHATAASNAAVDVDAADDGSVERAGASHSDATASQDQVSNTAVSVRVLSPGADGAVTQENRVDARASGDDAAATAVQDGVRNTYVGIRVESPGERGAVEQSTSGRASTTPGGTVAVASDGLDTAVVVDIDAPLLTVPGKTTVWEWIWVWHADESTLGDAASFAIGDASWSWTWGTLPGGTLVERDVTDLQPGTWRWNWAWDRDVEGWAWDWHQTAALACATCAWIWSWDWSWSGAPGAQPDEPPASSEGSSSAPDQETTVVASATAQAVATVDQLVEQDNGEAERFAGQIATVSQLADSSAVATQVLAPASGLLGVQGAGRRSLAVVAEADAISAIDQLIVQHGRVVGSGDAAQWAGQQTDVAQDVTADAAGAQQLGRTGPVEGSALAGAVAISSNEQSAGQDALLADGELSQWSGQLVVVAQVVGATARTSQMVRDAGNVRAASSSVTTDLSLGAQTIRQDGARSAGVGTQTAAQSLQIGQGAAADSTTSQTVGSWQDAPLARSDATAINRSIVMQTGVQAMNGASAVDIQDLLQDTLVVQLAYASSTSSGGIGGSARTVNCATTQQGAGQGIGAVVGVGVGDLTVFCTPPVEPAPNGTPGSGDPDGTPGSGDPDGTPGSSLEQAASVVTISTLAEAVSLARGVAFTPIGRASTPPGPGDKFSTERAPDVRGASGGTAVRSQVSSPPTPQARFDTRPEVSVVAKGVDGESPLPTTDGPSRWASALGAAAAGSGGSGIVAILFAFELRPSAFRHVREEAVVRRPASVFAPIDVPV